MDELVVVVVLAGFLLVVSLCCLCLLRFGVRKELVPYERDSIPCCPDSFIRQQDIEEVVARKKARPQTGASSSVMEVSSYDFDSNSNSRTTSRQSRKPLQLHFDAFLQKHDTTQQNKTHQVNPKTSNRFPLRQKMKITSAAATSIMLSATVGTALVRSTVGFVVRGPTNNAAVLATSPVNGNGGSVSTTTTQRSLFNRLFSNPAATSQYPIMASEEVMSQKKHGTSEKPVQKDLRWNCDFETAEYVGFTNKMWSYCSIASNRIKE